MGLGGDFNQNCRRGWPFSGGNAYFIEEPADIPEAFANELKASQSVALRALELKLRLDGGVELRRAPRSRRSATWACPSRWMAVSASR